MLLLFIHEKKMEPASSNQSKGSIFCNKVKTLLMRAWRERWQDNHWGVMLKKMLLDVPGESKELAGMSIKLKKKPYV